MKPSSTLKAFLSGVLVTLFVVGAGFVVKTYCMSDFEKPDIDLVYYVNDVLKNYYVSKNVEESALVYGAIRGMLESLEDPYTRFMEPKSFQDMQIRLDGEFYGIGINIGLRDKQLTVISPIPGTPAAKAGLRPMDRIVSIDGALTGTMSLNEAVSLIRGPRGQTVVLGILPPDSTATRSVNITREKIHVSVIEKQEVFPVTGSKVGYVRFNTFESKSASSELAASLRQMNKQKVDAFVLDLRGNGGGLLENAVSVASFFLPGGNVVQTVNREGIRSTKPASGDVIFEKPMVVLIDQGSASASEIVAGALKDNQRATIVGQHSFGKATVQSVLPLRDGSAVLFTVAKYLTPNGTDISKSGITVNVEAAISTDDMRELYMPEKYTYARDPQLQKALQVAVSQLGKKGS
ncbi:MAG: S41 family peptidase [Candidatus Margulisiibacteriota bacterium]